MLGLETADPGGDVGTLVVLHAGEADRTVTLGGEELPTAGLHPVGDELVGGRVAGVAVLESLGGDVLDLRLERVDVGDDRGAGGHVPLVVLLELDEVEVVSASLDLGGALHRLLGDREEGHAGREGECFLAAGEHDVDAELVHRNGQDGEGGDGVDDEQDLGELLEDIGEFLDRVHAPGGGLVVDECHHVDVTLGETLLEELGGDRVAPLDLKLLGLVAAALGDVVPLVGEGAGHAVEDLPLHEVAEGTFHHAPRGGGGDVDGSGRLEELLESRLNRGVELFEIIAAMADHRLAECLESFFGNLNGSRAEEFDVCAHEAHDFARNNQFSQRKFSNFSLESLALASSALGPPSAAICP